VPSPRIRVVVPTYRRADRLPRLVAALEAQTLPPEDFEVVIVDDGSADATAQILGRLAATATINLAPVILDHNRGQGAARNHGWRSATTPFVAFTDDDCIPEPQWLASGLAGLETDAETGVVQGCTRRPAGSTTDWTVFREVLAPSPWFEGCNLFFRREALEAAGGFDEVLRSGCEDTMLGWGVLASGWGRAFADQAIVWHDNDERGVGYHLRYGWREGRICTVAHRHPAFRRAGLWRPCSVRPLNVAYCLALVGGVLGLFWRRRFLGLALPYVWMRRPPTGHHRYFRLLIERFAVDTAIFAGMKVGAVRERLFIL
jgi:GT2 family glycosyltransferase